MKGQNGITLIALVISVILLTMVTTMLILLSDFFFSNSKNLEDTSKNIAEFNKFNMYFIEDVKNNDSIRSISNTEIIFNDGTVYTFKAAPDNGIYRNKVKICNNIALCKFDSTDKVETNITKKILKVRIIITGNSLFDTENDYVLKYW